MKILHRYTNAVLFDAPNATTMRDALTAAITAGADLAGADLAGANLAGADLTGAYLTRADLTRAYLTRANLAGANLAGANLAEANLAGANLGPLFIVARAMRSDGHEAFLWSSVLGGAIVRGGCRTFTPAEFRAHAATYADPDRRTETLAILDYLESQLPAARARKARELGAA